MNTSTVNCDYRALFAPLPALAAEVLRWAPAGPARWAAERLARAVEAVCAADARGALCPCEARAVEEHAAGCPGEPVLCDCGRLATDLLSDSDGIVPVCRVCGEQAQVDARAEEREHRRGDAAEERYRVRLGETL